MSLVCIPRREDFFPKTKRGHGTRNSRDRKTMRIVSGVAVLGIRKATACVDSTCQLNAPKSKNLHTDQGANLQEWCDDHKLSTTHCEPYVAMIRATGGR